MAGRKEIRVGGRSFAVSNSAKVMYSIVGFEKVDLIDYYLRMAPMILPHLEGRPLTLTRSPDGVEGHYFYQKQCPSPCPPLGFYGRDPQ